MLTLSKPISAGQAQAYHKSEFANAKENYYTEGERVRGVWQGQLAERWGLRGEVNEEQFARLSEGQHPATGEALVRRLAFTNWWIGKPMDGDECVGKSLNRLRRSSGNSGALQFQPNAMPSFWGAAMASRLPQLSRSGICSAKSTRPDWKE
jgi:hypothetical protein